MKIMASLKELRERWKTEDGKRRRKEIINHLLNIATRGIVENKKIQTHAQIKGILQDFPYTNETNQADLRGIDLEGEKLPQVYIYNVDLSGANLGNSHFGGAQFEGVDLRGANFSNADLSNININQAKVGKYPSEEECTNLSQTDLRYAKFNNILYSDLKYGGYRLKKNSECEKAEGSYRVLRSLFKDIGQYKDADRCYRQERKSKRKQKNVFIRIFEWLVYELTCGYGMRPYYLIGWIIFIIFAFMFKYFYNSNQFVYVGNIQANFSIWTALYFSIVTFTTLGLGDWHPNPNSSIQYWIATEAILGVIFIALVVITYSRKMIRD